MRSKAGQVRVINLHKAYKVNERLVKRIVLRVLEYCKMRGGMDLEIIFLTDRGIRRLNKRYKGEARSTDVLSFELGGSAYGAGPFLGEIFISIDKARKNSKVFKTAFKDELTLYIIHGILHLACYDDETLKERARMDKRQKEILEDLCKREDLSKVLMPR